MCCFVCIYKCCNDLEEPQFLKKLFNSRPKRPRPQKRAALNVNPRSNLGAGGRCKGAHSFVSRYTLQAPNNRFFTCDMCKKNKQTSKGLKSCTRCKYFKCLECERNPPKKAGSYVAS